jgi:hypothetical protein
MKNKETLEQSVENKCVAGCKHYYGGEIKHHKDCVYYPESFSKMYDDLKWRQEQDKNKYSEEEVMDMFHNFSMHLPLHYEFLVREQFKKK